MTQRHRPRKSASAPSSASDSFVRAFRSGVSAVEFALVLPMMLALVLIVLGMAVAAYDRLSAAYGVAEDTRTAAIDGGLGTKTSSLVGRSPTWAASASGCSRTFQGTIDSTRTRDWPIIEWLGHVLVGPMTASLTGSSTAVRWEFAPGYAGECQ